MTGYIVHYKNTTFVRTKSVSQYFTSTFLLGLTRGATYTISVEATSQQLSGESEKMNITLGKWIRIQQMFKYIVCIHTHRHNSHLET